ncbi:MAG TPA: GH25 family lysozyme [Candidatus Limnocylindrales bacterium]|nr:GH25 family lysozyme [Candidatus Limnocylindrales bacterium]
MGRVLAVTAALSLVVAIFASPSPVDAKPNPKPHPTPKPTPTPTATPVPGTLNGIDISYHQGSIDWSRVAGAEKTFAFVRASAGTLTSDPAYRSNVAGARAVGLKAGSYHFGNPDSAPDDAVNEARWFLQNATLVSGDLIPVLDLEVSNGLSAAALTTWAQTWLTEVESATGVRPLIYTNPTFWSGSMGGTDWFARNGYRLWVAHWTSASQPTVPAANWAGNGWTFWQHSSRGTVPGVNGEVDLDRFNGTSLPDSLFVP